MSYEKRASAGISLPFKKALDRKSRARMLIVENKLLLFLNRTDEADFTIKQ